MYFITQNEGYGILFYSFITEGFKWRIRKVDLRLSSENSDEVKSCGVVGRCLTSMFPFVNLSIYTPGATMLPYAGQRLRTTHFALEALTKMKRLFFSHLVE